MNRFYTFALTLALPFLLLRLAWRSRQLPDYRRRWAERFGCFAHAPHVQNKQDAPHIWVHTVSVGEFLAARPLINALLERYPDMPMVISCTTPTGSAQIVKHLGDKVQHVYLPFDLPWLIKRFVRFFNPKVALFMETELWPNTLRLLKKKQIPTILLNARLSERSANSYTRIAKTVHAMLNSFSVIIAQDQKDGDRFVKLGLPQDHLYVAGNIKFDMALPEALDQKTQAMRDHLNIGDRKVLVAASTHEGEETKVLEAFKQCKQRMPNLLLLLVPRHPDRFQKVFDQCTQAGFKVAKRSEDTLIADADIVIGDSMGEMMIYYNCADIAFVGGSLMPIGGHNLIEPAMLTKPIVTGPNLQNFMAVKSMLEAADAVAIVPDESALAEQVCAWLDNPAVAGEIAQRGAQVAHANRGALEKHLDRIAQYL
jgi:3-deoxy-D-manno-octulosonic-acid transferase